MPLRPKLTKHLSPVFSEDCGFVRSQPARGESKKENTTQHTRNQRRAKYLKMHTLVYV